MWKMEHDDELVNEYDTFLAGGEAVIELIKENDEPLENGVLVEEFRTKFLEHKDTI